MSNSQALRDTAAFLLAQANLMDGIQPPSGFNMNDKASWWPSMREQFRNDEKPHAWRDWGTDTPLPDQAGDNEPESPLYESHKTFWRAMEMLNVLDLQRERFSMLNCRRRGGWSDFEENVRFLWANADGIKWRADPLNSAILPKKAP